MTLLSEPLILILVDVNAKYSLIGNLIVSSLVRMYRLSCCTIPGIGSGGVVSISKMLTLKALSTTAADDIHKYFFIVFQRK